MVSVTWDISPFFLVISFLSLGGIGVSVGFGGGFFCEVGIAGLIDGQR